MAFSELIALYLFLGGASAGSFAVLSVIDLRIAFSTLGAAGSLTFPRITSRAEAGRLPTEESAGRCTGYRSP